MANKSYKLSASIALKYAPLINRSSALHEQTPKLQFATLRESGFANVDLWSDGMIYLKHFVTDTRPLFRFVSNLLEFVREGKRGLLGYVESLSSCDSTTAFNFKKGKREI